MTSNEKNFTNATNSSGLDFTYVGKEKLESFPQSPSLVGDSFYFKATPRWSDFLFLDVTQLGPCGLIPLFDILAITAYEFAQLLPLPLPGLCIPALVSVFVVQEVIG